MPIMIAMQRRACIYEWVSECERKRERVNGSFFLLLNLRRQEQVRETGVRVTSVKMGAKNVQKHMCACN